MAITFYHAPQSRALIAHWMLEELGQPYDMKVLDLKQGDHKKPAFLKINPMGKVPAIVHDGQVVTEAAAICAYLADAFPAAKLAPAPGDPRRAPYFRWMFFGPSCMEPAVMARMLKHEDAPTGQVGYGSFDATFDAAEGAIGKGPWVLGDIFSAVDVAFGSQILWGMKMVGIIPERPSFTAYVDRIMTRPAMQRVFAQNEKLAKG